MTGFWLFSRELLAWRFSRLLSLAVGLRGGLIAPEQDAHSEQRVNQLQVLWEFNLPKSEGR
jgi:hypothetical protein